MAEAERDSGVVETEAALTRRFYADLREIAGRVFAQERTGHTLQPTAVVNEACLRIMKSGLPDVAREERLALAGRVLKQVLVDHARARGADKRGGGEGVARVEFGENVLAKDVTLVELGRVQRAMERLHALNERQAEIVKLRVFSGLTMDQAATVMGVSKRTAEADWTIARAWLRRELAEGAE